ncbi:MAG TPA: CesT family type III secretion system chaperone [Kofleriaceae bacterium]|jgi:hypothetical protein|nr:CesT family type III secretion system chaperone [Kofleriaceae bacterium]
MSDDALAKVAGYLERFAQERDLALPPLDQGVARIQRGSAVVSVHVLHQQGVLLYLARVAAAPAPGDEARLRQLLTASFTTTGDAAFALHPETGEVYLRILRSIDGLDYDEFEDLLHTIATVADDWDDRLKAS